jgi:hypothetical protein
LALLLGFIGGVALSAAAGARRTDTAYPRLLRWSSAAGVVVIPDCVGLGGFYTALARLPQVASMWTEVVYELAVPASGSAPAGQLEAIASPDGTYGQITDRVRILAGQQPPSNDPAAVMVDQQLAARQRLRPGSTLHLLGVPSTAKVCPAQKAALATQSRPVRLDFRVSAVVAFDDQVVPSPGLAAAPRVLLSPAFWRSGAGHGFGPGDAAGVRLRPGASVASFSAAARALARQYPAAGSLSFEKLSGPESATQRAIYPEVVALAVFAALAGILALAMLGQIIGRQLIMDAADFPVLRSLGMSRTQLATLSLARAGVVTGCGAVIAVAVAASPLMPIGPARLAEPSPGIEANLAVLVPGLVIIAAMPLALLSPVAWRVARRPHGPPGRAGPPSPQLPAGPGAGHGRVGNRRHRGANGVRARPRPQCCPGAQLARCDVPVLATGLLAALGVTVACSAWPGWRTTVPAAAARPAEPGQGGPTTMPGLVAGAVPLAMGVRLALRRGRGRTAVPVGSAVASAAVGVAALSAAIVFGGSVTHLLASPVLYGVTWDAAVSNTGSVNVAPIVAAARNDPQVAAWTTVRSGGPIQIGPAEADMLVLPAGGSSFVPAPVTGRLPRTSREIALGTRTLGQARARIGTSLRVSVDGQPARLMTVVGTTVFPTMTDELDLGTGAALTPGGLSYLLPASGQIIPADTVFVRFQSGVSPPAGRRTLAARLAPRGHFAIDGPATPTDLLNFGQVQDLPQLLGAGLGAVALLTIGHLLITSVRRRQRDLAILRVLGFTSWQVRRTLGWQAVTLAGLALVIGIPAGIFCGRLGWLIFAHQLGVTPVLAVPSVELPVLAAGWLAAAVVIATLPAEAAVRSRPARILRSE